MCRLRWWCFLMGVRCCSNLQVSFAMAQNQMTHFLPFEPFSVFFWCVFFLFKMLNRSENLAKSTNSTDFFTSCFLASSITSNPNFTRILELVYHNHKATIKGVFRIIVGPSKYSRGPRTRSLTIIVILYNGTDIHTQAGK